MGPIIYWGQDHSLVTVDANRYGYSTKESKRRMISGEWTWTYESSQHQETFRTLGVSPSEARIQRQWGARTTPPGGEEAVLGIWKQVGTRRPWGQMQAFEIWDSLTFVNYLLFLCYPWTLSEKSEPSGSNLYCTGRTAPFPKLSCKYGEQYLSFPRPQERRGYLWSAQRRVQTSGKLSVSEAADANRKKERKKRKRKGKERKSNNWRTWRPSSWAQLKTVPLKNFQVFGQFLWKLSFNHQANGSSSYHKCKSH